MSVKSLQFANAECDIFQYDKGQHCLKQTATVMTDFTCANIYLKVIKTWTGGSKSIA